MGTCLCCEPNQTTHMEIVTETLECKDRVDEQLLNIETNVPDIKRQKIDEKSPRELVDQQKQIDESSLNEEINGIKVLEEINLTNDPSICEIGYRAQIEDQISDNESENKFIEEQLNEYKMDQESISESLKNASQLISIQPNQQMLEQQLMIEQRRELDSQKQNETQSTFVSRPEPTYQILTTLRQTQRSNNNLKESIITQLEDLKTEEDCLGQQINYLLQTGKRKDAREKFKCIQSYYIVRKYIRKYIDNIKNKYQLYIQAQTGVQQAPDEADQAVLIRDNTVFLNKEQKDQYAKFKIIDQQTQYIFIIIRRQNCIQQCIDQQFQQMCP